MKTVRNLTLPEGREFLRNSTGERTGEIDFRCGTAMLTSFRDEEERDNSEQQKALLLAGESSLAV
jgi:hypothetical protein